MAFHRNLASMLRESLPEYVAVARMAIGTRKDPDRPMSHHGFAAAVLLFSVTDALGSYFRRSTTFTVQVDGKSRSIDGDGFNHFFVLNSAFYQQTLTEPQLKALYECYRCPLSHNSSLVPGVVLFPVGWLRAGVVVGSPALTRAAEISGASGTPSGVPVPSSMMIV